MHKKYFEMKWILVALLIATVFVAGTVYAGTIRGVITDAETDAPLIGANIVLDNTRRGAATDLDGFYTIFNIEPGIYMAKVTMLGYELETVEGIKVEEKGTVTINVNLRESAMQLEELIFTAGAEAGSQERELEERLDEAKITDAISKETLTKLPDPDVANVVRRATGVSVDKGDPIVRGLGVRYSKVTLNNAAVAGTEPNRSAVSLELFPSSLMDQVTISKSFLPDQNGEFAGGVVNMSTLSLPKNLQIGASVSASYNTETTFKQFYGYQGGNLDFLGFDDGTRAKPEAIADADQKIREGNYNLNQLTDFGRAFSNNWDTQQGTAAPNMNYSVSIGNQSSMFGRPLGFMISGLYSYGNKTLMADRNVFQGGAEPGQVDLWHDYEFELYTRTVNLGSMAALKYQLSDMSNINFNLLYSRDVSDETRFFSGYNKDRDKEIRSTRLRWVAEQTVTSQLFGNHAVPGLFESTVDWQVTYSRGTRDEPDTRETQYELEEGTGEWVFADETYSGSRIFNDLNDDTYSGGLDWTSMPLGSFADFELKTGVSGLYKDRRSDYNRYEFTKSPNFRIEDLTQDPEDLFIEDNINPVGWVLSEYTRPTDSYTANQTMYAGYVMGEANLTSRLFATGGVRYEYSNQQVETFEPFFSSSPPVTSDLETGDLLPALSLRYLLRERMNLRLAASQTISRPDFRELAPFEFTDFVGGRAIKGNSDLNRALIRNVDLRWEMVHGVADLIAVSAFVKDFDNPIETVVIATAQNQISFANAKGATNYGVEFEVRQNLGLIDDDLSTLTVSTNLSLIESQVEVGGGTGQIQTSEDRALMGQSPYLFNMGLGYVHPHYGTQVNLFYNTFGDRIAEVGANQLPDVIEEARHDLDLTARQPFGRGLALKLAMKNILNSDYMFTQGGKVAESYKRGRIFSVGLSWSN